MADSSNGKELSMEMRLLLAFILMGAVLFLTQYFYTPATPPRPPAQQSETQQPVAQQPEVKPKPPEPEPAEPPAEVPGAVAAASEEEHTIETDVYKIVFSNKGAVVKSWVLKDYVDGAGNPLELVHGADYAGDESLPQAVKDSVASMREQVDFPFAVEFDENETPGLDPNEQLYMATEAASGKRIDFEFSDGNTVVRKSFVFDGGYRFEFSSEVAGANGPVPHLVVWRGGFGDSRVANAPSTSRTLYYDTVAQELNTMDAGDVEDGPVVVTGRYSFAGLEDSYFAAVALPGNGNSFDLWTFADTAAVGPEAKEQPHVGAALGGRGKNAFPMYVGPKDVDLLEETDPRLTQLVDFGFFAILAKPLFIALKWLHDHWIPNYGWAIVLLTVAINFLTLPLKFTSLKSMRKMQALQPLVKQINEKYKGVGMRDPKKAQQNEEMMALYKKHGVNPLGGCMPMILQIPFFFAFYKVLNVAIELRGADWLWVRDLSQPEHLPIHILPIVMTLSQFAMQKMTPSTTPDPNQQRMMMLMPFMFLFFFYNVSSGLVLYWLTSNLVGVAQQLGFNKLMPADATPIVETPPAGKSKRRRSGKSR